MANPKTARKERVIPFTTRTLLLQKWGIFLLAFLLYANVIPNDFNLDDELYHTRAAQIAGADGTGLSEIFTTRTFIEGESRYEYRPVALLSFVVQYKVFGQNQHISHFISVLLYAVTCWLLFILLLNWLNAGRSWLAFFIALLFTLHPLHTEVVASIKNRDELLSLLFLLLSVLTSWKAYSLSRPWYLGIAAIMFLLAMLCKITIIVAFMLIPLGYFFFSELPGRKLILYTAIVFAAPLVFWGISTLLPEPHRVLQAHENPLYVAGMGFLSKSAIAFYVMTWYMLLHLFPYQLAYYYGSNYVPTVGWSNVVVIVSLLVHLSMLIYVVLNFRKKKLLTFGLTIYLVAMFANSNLTRVVPGLMAERYAYLSSFGFCIVLCVLLYGLLKVAPDNSAWTDAGARRLLACLCVVGLMYSARVIARNADWKDKYTLFTHDMTYLESSAKANMLHGDLFSTLSTGYRSTAQQLQQQNPTLAAVYYDSATDFNNIAIHNFKQALTITPGFSAAMINLGLAYFAADSQQFARQYLLKALTLVPGNAKVNCNLGILYFKAGMYDSAVIMVRRAIAADSNFAIGYQTLTDIQLSGHDTVAAIQTLELAAKNIAKPLAAYVDLGSISLQRKDTIAAVRYFETAAPLKPGSVFALSFLVQYYQQKQDSQRANFYYNILAQLQAERAAQ